MKEYKVFAGYLGKDIEEEVAALLVRLGWLPNEDENGVTPFDKIDDGIHEDWTLTVPEEDNKLLSIFVRHDLIEICRY